MVLRRAWRPGLEGGVERVAMLRRSVEIWTRRRRHGVSRQIDVPETPYMYIYTHTCIYIHIQNMYIDIRERSASYSPNFTSLSNDLSFLHHHRRIASSNFSVFRLWPVVGTLIFFFCPACDHQKTRTSDFFTFAERDAKFLIRNCVFVCPVIFQLFFKFLPNFRKNCNQVGDEDKKNSTIDGQDRRREK